TRSTSCATRPRRSPSASSAWWTPSATPRRPSPPEVRLFRRLPACDPGKGRYSQGAPWFSLPEGKERTGTVGHKQTTQHRFGKALGDEPSAKTLQFVGGEAVEAYKAWRSRGNKPPRTDPYYVPDEVGRMIHEQATRDLVAVVRLAHYLGKFQDRKVAVPGFVG